MLEAEKHSSQLQALRDETEQALGFRDAEGNLVPGAYDQAILMLKNFVTASGKLPKETIDVLGGADYGRNDVLFELLRCLTGPEPILRAWLEAIRAGSFKKIAFVGYRPTRNEGGPTLGPPGTYLARFLAKIRSDLAQGRKPHVNRVLFAETAMMTLVVIAAALQDATRAGAALGVAFVIMADADDLTTAQHRQLDAQAGNPEFVAALRIAISDVLARFPAPAESERTASDIQRSLPKGVDIERYFSEREERRLSEVRSALLDAFRRQVATRASVGAKSSIYDRMVKTITDPKTVIDGITGYLRSSNMHSAAELARHHHRLREIMVDLGRPCDEEVLKVRAMMAVNQYYPNPSALSGSSIIDQGFKRLAGKILDYARYVGPPPPGVPLQHLRMFEDMAIFVGLQGGAWPARAKWQEAGLVGDHVRALSNAEMNTIIDRTWEVLAF